MKHILFSALAALILSGCYVSSYPPGDGSTYPTPTNYPTPNPTGTPVPGAQTVANLYFPDANLRACVARTGAYYVNQLTNLACQNQSIRSTTGINQLTALQHLNLRNNPINTLNVRGLALRTLDVSNDWQNGMLSNIEMGAQADLYDVNISGNNFSAFSTQWMPSLSAINFSHNRISQMDFSSNTRLATLHGRDNQLTSISVADGPLADVDLQNNLLRTAYFPNPWSLRSANLANNRLYQFGALNTRNLTYLNLADNDFTAFALPANVSDLVIDNNQLTWLDTSGNPELRNLSAANNKLTSLALGNGLTYLNVANNQLRNVQLPSTLAFVDVTNNELTLLDTNQLVQLDSLTVDQNALQYIDVRSNDQLNSLSAQASTLSSVNLTENAKLVSLDLDSNALQSLLTDYNDKLQDISANNNSLRDGLIDFQQQEQLRSLSLRNNNLSELRLDYSKYLDSVDLRGNSLTGKTIEHLQGLNLDKLNY